MKMAHTFKKNNYIIYSDSEEESSSRGHNSDSSFVNTSTSNSDSSNSDLSSHQIKNSQLVTDNEVIVENSLCKENDCEESLSTRQSIVEKFIIRDFNDVLVLDSSASVASESLINNSDAKLSDISKKSFITENPKRDIIIEESSDSSDSEHSVELVCSFSNTNLQISNQKKENSKDEINSDSDSVRVIGTSKLDNSVQNQSKAASTSSLSHSELSNSSQTSVHNIDERKLLEQQLALKRTAYQNILRAIKCCDPKKLKDGGKLLQEKLALCKEEVNELKEKLKNITNVTPDKSTYKNDKYTVESNNLFSTTDQITENLGKKGLETHRVHQALTVDALVTLHSSFETCPAENVREKDPAGLRIQLMPHQKYALAWLLWREKQVPPGGILADDMGLGKTLTMISLVLRSNEYEKQSNIIDNAEPFVDNNVKMYHGRTLVVCPSSLLGQWESQIKQHCKPRLLTSLIHHGKPRELQAKKLAALDIVITSYGVVVEENKFVKENKKGALFRVKWKRIIIDEGHVIRNHKTKTAQALCELEAKYRWCLTGTPVQNKELDMFSLLKFLRCTPFDNLTVWKRWVDNKSANGVQRLNTIVKSILLRRTKEDLLNLGELNDLPTKTTIPIYISLDEEEREVYHTVLQFSKTLLAEFILQEQKKAGFDNNEFKNKQYNLLNSVKEIKTTEIFVLLLRLRQICCLPGLIHSMLEKDSCTEDGIDIEDDPILQDLTSQMKRMSVAARNSDKEPELTDRTQKILVKSNPVFKIDRPSVKIQTVIKIVKESLDAGDKIVVVSQWANFLQKLKVHILALKTGVTILDGSVPVKFRSKIIEDFNNPDTDIRVMLLSLTAGGVGLNLVGGNRLIIVEPHWNPQLESQACDRVYRVGQKKVVHIYKIICKDTIEEKVELLQKKKLEVANTILKGELKFNRQKITLADLKILFDVHDN